MNGNVVKYSTKKMYDIIEAWFYTIHTMRFHLICAKQLARSYYNRSMSIGMCRCGYALL